MPLAAWPTAPCAIDAQLVPAVIQDLLAALPLWARWTSAADQLELQLHTMALRILALRRILIDLDVGVAVFHTGVSHHLDTLAIELACRQAKIPQVFLYSVILSGRLLPLVQCTGIDDRRPLGVAVSSYVHTPLLHEMMRKGTSLRSRSAEPAATRAGPAALLRLFGTAARHRASVVARPKLKPNLAAFFTPTATQTNLATDVRLIRQQSEAITYYDVIAGGVEPAMGATSAPTLALLAHFQPEATSFPEGGRLSNHVDLVAAIRRHGYSREILYFEHPGIDQAMFDHGPSRVGVARSIQYYKDLRSLGCTFIRRDTAYVDLVKGTSSIVPVTLTGSITIERALEGKPTFVGGHPWFSGVPGEIRLKSLPDLSRMQLSDSPELAGRAAAYLGDLLDLKTLTNQPGIGTSGRPSRQDTDRTAMIAELTTLLDALQEGSHSIWRDASAAH